MLPEYIVQQTLNNTINIYLSLEEDHIYKPRIQYRYRFPRSRYTRQRETVSSNTFFLQLNESRSKFPHTLIFHTKDQITKMDAEFTRL